MNFKVLATAASLMCFLLALVWVCAPALLLGMWGLEFSYPVGLVSRRAGALFAGIGVMLFLARAAPPSAARSAIGSGLGVGCAALAVLGVFEFATGHASPAILAAVLVEVAVALAFLHVGRKQSAPGPAAR